MDPHFEVFNPKSLPEESLPVIYGFNNGGGGGLWHGQLMAEDGTALGGHACSSEGFMLGDLGILRGRRPDRHEGFQKHYPAGYRMEFVSYNDVPKHEKLMAAFALHQAQPEPESSENGSERT